MILRIILWSIVLVFIIRFVVRFLFPIFQLTRMAKGRLQQMQQQMDDMQKRAAQPSPNIQSNKAVNDNDYIEYEEVK